MKRLIALLLLSTSLLAFNSNDLNRQLFNTKAKWYAKENIIKDNAALKKEFGIVQSYKSMVGNPVQNDIMRITADVTNLPSYLDWSHSLTPVKNQGSCGSCVAFAALGVMEGQFNITNGTFLNYNLSEQYTFSCGGYGCNGGWTLQAASKFLKSTGTPDEACYPYYAGRDGVDYSCNAACADLNGRVKKIKGSQTITSWGEDTQAIMTALQKGVLMTAMQVYEDFISYQGGIYSHVSGELLGGHAVTIVGYNANERYWLVRNSWGADWGENGYFKIAWGDESGLGASSILFDVPKLTGYVKVIEPNENVYLNGFTSIKVENNYKADYIKYTLKGIGGTFTDNQIAEGINAFNIDTTRLPDGTYDLSASAIMKNGTEVSSDYSRVFILNSEPFGKVTLTAPKTNSKVSGVIDVNLDCSSTPVEANLLELHINGQIEKIVKIENPCPAVRLKNRTARYPNGTYEYYGVLKMGDRIIAQSNKATVTIKN